MGQLRYEQNLPTPFNADSVYKPIERVERQFNPLQIPKQGKLIDFFLFVLSVVKTVVASLPFEEKMRVAAPKRNRMNQDEARIVVRSKKEKKTDELLENLELLKEQKLKKEEEKKRVRFEKFSKEKAKEEERVKESFFFCLFLKSCFSLGRNDRRSRWKQSSTLSKRRGTRKSPRRAETRTIEK